MKLKQQQHGLTFMGLIIVGILLALAGVVFAQVVPTYIEFIAVQEGGGQGGCGHHGGRGAQHLRQGGAD